MQISVFINFVRFRSSSNRKEKEFEEGMNHLQKDIDTLEMEKRDLRENLKVHGGTKKGDTKQSTTYGSGNIHRIHASDL